MKSLRFSFVLMLLGFGGFVAGSSLQEGDKSGAMLGAFLYVAGVMLMDQFSPRPANFIDSPVTRSGRILSLIGVVFTGAVAAYAAVR